MNIPCFECETEIDFPTPEKEGGKWKSEAICPNCGLIHIAWVVKRNKKVKLDA
jgi:hypothetical protein